MPASNTGIYTGQGIHIVAEEIDEIHKAIEEITTELIAILGNQFESIDNSYFIEAGNSLEKYMLLFKSVNAAKGNGGNLTLPEPNLFGSIFSLAHYYELIQGFAEFALREYQDLDEIFKRKITDYNREKESQYNG